MIHDKKKLLLKLINVGMVFSLILSHPLNSYGEVLTESEREELPVASSSWVNWPEGPVVSAKSALLMEAKTGAILYDKNIHERMYPASTTKLMTTLLAMEKENVSLDDMVYFSESAISSVPRDASNIGIDIGEALTFEECLYGVLVASANEVSNGLAEFVAGDIDSFVRLMNEKAKELGCEDTHFNNPHGYTDSNHYTSAYDLALISREFSENELLSKISRTPNYHFVPTDTQPDDFTVGSTNFFMKGYYYCDGLISSKTGFTDESGQVLVTCAEKNGMRLIAVVMMEDTPKQYVDTLELLNYGFDNFDLVNVSDVEKKYTVTDDNFFHSNYDILGSSKGFIFLDSTAKVVVPKTTNFENLNSTLTYNNDDDNHFAIINYDYKGVYLGSANLLMNEDTDSSLVFTEDLPENTVEEDNTLIIYIDRIMYGAVALVLIVIITALIRRFIKTNHILERRKARSRWKKRRRFR